MDWQEGSLSKYEAVLIQDTLKDTFVWARPKNRKPAVMVAGVLQKGKTMNLDSEISIQTDKFAKKCSIVSNNPDECAKLIESWHGLQQEYEQWLVKEYMKALGAQMSDHFWA